MLLKINKPKPSQTLYLVERERGRTPTMKKLFVEKVVTTKKTETIVGMKISSGGKDENGQYIQKQKLIKKMLNHTYIKTRCGKEIDLTTDGNNIFASKKKAKQALFKLSIIMVDEFWSLNKMSSF